MCARILWRLSKQTHANSLNVDFVLAFLYIAHSFVILCLIRIKFSRNTRIFFLLADWLKREMKLSTERERL